LIEIEIICGIYDGKRHRNVDIHGIESNIKHNFFSVQDSRKAQKLYYFSEILKHLPRSEWYGPDGAISKTVRGVGVRADEGKFLSCYRAGAKECGIKYDGFTVEETKLKISDG
jgi:hypothetical protein